jgi:hypothetical protein
LEDRRGLLAGQLGRRVPTTVPRSLDGGRTNPRGYQGPLSAPPGGPRRFPAAAQAILRRPSARPDPPQSQPRIAIAIRTPRHGCASGEHKWDRLPAGEAGGAALSFDDMCAGPRQAGRLPRLSGDVPLARRVMCSRPRTCQAPPGKWPQRRLNSATPVGCPRRRSPLADCLKEPSTVAIRQTRCV